MAGYWGFSFGATALAAAILQLDVRGSSSYVAGLALPLFVIINLFIIYSSSAR